MNQDFMRTKPILPLVLSMALPMMLSMLINSLYNIVDSMFVARLGEQALTAVSLVYPLQTLIVSIGVGFGVGINATVAFFMGAGEKEKADRAASQGLFLSLVHGILLSVGTVICIPYFLPMFTADNLILAWGREYAVIVLSFSVVVTVQIAFEKIYQSTGNMFVPMVCMAAGSITNIILDPVFIFGLGPVPRLEVKGAAIATAIGQVVTLLLYLIWYFKKDMGLSIKRTYMKPTADICRRVYMVGVPCSMTMGLPSLLITILNGFAAAFSPIYILILGVYFKLQSFIYLPANGIVQGMRPILSYNYGADERKRMKRIIQICGAMILAIMAVGMLLFLVFSGSIMKMFTVDSVTVREGALALRIISFGFVVSGVSVVCSGALEALGKGFASFLISLLRYLALIVPAAYLGIRIAGVIGIWTAFPAAEALTAVASVIIFVICYKKK